MEIVNMGMTMKYFFVNDDESVMSIPLARINKLHDYDPKVTFPELAGKKVRVAWALVTTQGRHLVAITSVEGCYLVFDSNGMLSREWWDEQVQRSFVRYGEYLESIIPHDDKKVIHAATKFMDKKEKPAWNVTSNILDQILKTLQIPWKGYE
jgi:hypothetical protein